MEKDKEDVHSPFDCRLSFVSSLISPLFWIERSNRLIADDYRAFEPKLYRVR